MAVNTLAQLPFNTVHMHDEVGGEDNSTVIDVNDDQINEKYDQSLLDVIDPDINVIGNDNVINHDLHVNFIEHDLSILSDIDPDIHNNNYSDSHYYKENSFNNVFKQSKDQLSVIHLNIRSIPANLTQFRAHLDTLSINFKIIALSETAINSHHTCYNIPGYTIEQDIRPKRKSGGVALYIDSTLQYTVRNDLNLGDNTNSIFVEIDRNQLKSKYNTIIGCIYRPPSYSLQSFNDSLTNMLSILQKKKKHILIAGDFNVNVDPL